MKNLSRPFVFALLATSPAAFAAPAPAAPATAAPALDVGPVCPAGSKYADLLSSDRLGAYVSAFRYGVMCQSADGKSNTVVLLEQDQANPLRFVPKFSVKNGTIEALFLGWGVAASARAMGGGPIESSLLFAQAPEAGAQPSALCPDQGTLEVKTVSLVAEWGEAVSITKPKSAGFCVKAPKKIEPGALLPLTVLDVEPNNDRLNPKGRVVMVNGSMDPDEMIVADADFKTGQYKVTLRLSGEKIFENGCGHYMVGAKLLPKSTKLAIVYRTPSVLLADTSVADGDVKEIYNGDVPNMARTCEGAILQYGALDREITLQYGTRKFYFLNYNLKTNRMELTELSY